MERSEVGDAKRSFVSHIQKVTSFVVICSCGWVSSHKATIESQEAVLARHRKTHASGGGVT